MGKNKKGLPRNLDPDSEDYNPEGVEQQQQTPKEFAEEFFGEGATAEDQDGMPPREWLKAQFKTKSAVIRYLINQEFTVKQIAKHLGIRYQHVRNVATNPLKRGPNEDWRPKHMREQPHMNDGKQSDSEVDV